MYYRCIFRHDAKMLVVKEKMLSMMEGSFSMTESRLFDIKKILSGG
jgi:hypothetical protein